MSVIYEDDNCALLMAPWGSDTRPSLFGIKKRHTETQRTEVHILSPESGYTQYSLHVASGLHETNRHFTFRLADWTGTGVPDLWAIKRWATGTNMTEVHIYSGESNFADAVFHGATALEETGDNFDFDLTVQDQNHPPDLVAIKRALTSDPKRTEVHVLSGADQFKSYKLHQKTALHETGTGRDWLFSVTGWPGGNTNRDLAVVSPANAGELHVLKGPDYQTFLTHRVISEANLRQECAPDASDAHWDVYIKCSSIIPAYAGTLGALFLTPLTMGTLTLAIIPAKMILVNQIMDCVRSLNKYKRIPASPSGRGGTGSPDVGEHPDGLPHGPRPPAGPGPAPQLPSPSPDDPLPDPPPPDPEDPSDPGPGPIS